MVKFRITEEMNQRQAFEVLTKLVILFSTAIGFVLVNRGQTVLASISALIAIFFCFTTVNEDIENEKKEESSICLK